MSGSSPRDPTSPRTTFGFWPRDTGAEGMALGPDDLLSDPDGEALFLPNETAPENDRTVVGIQPRRSRD